MEITTQQSEKLMSLAKAKAKEINVAMNIAIIDKWGHLKAFARMDDAFLGSIDIAIKKAKTSMLFRMNTEQVGEFLKPEVAAYGMEATSGGLIGFPGGMPIKANGEIIGYIGVSGGFPTQDQTVAAAGSNI